MFKELCEYLDYEQPTKYIVSNDNYSDDFKIPVLTAGQTFILGYTNEIDNVFPEDKLPVIIFDDFTTSFKFVDFPFKVKSSAMKILHAKEGNDIKFLYYLMKTISFDSSTHKRYWISEYSKINVKSYTLEEQKKIVSELNKIESAIKNRNDSLIDADNILTSKYYEMFGKITDFNELSDCCSTITDYVASGSFASLRENVKHYDTEEYALMIKTADFNNNFTQNLTYTDKHGYDFLHNSNLFGGELLLSNIGASIGKVLRVPFLNRPMTLAPNSIMIKSNDNYSDDFLQYFFLSDYGQKQLKHMTTATAMPKFNKTQLKKVKIPNVPLETQKQFSNYANLIMDYKNILVSDINDLNQLMDSKLNYFFK